MNDKELLELAAKAAGLKGLHERAGKLCYTINDGHGGSLMWNPLHDDGDALRLAVKLGIHITNSHTDAWASTPAVTITEPHTKCPYASTRRAIVRAAAAIGESME